MFLWEWEKNVNKGQIVDMYKVFSISLINNSDDDRNFLINNKEPFEKNINNIEFFLF